MRSTNDNAVPFISRLDAPHRAALDLVPARMFDLDDIPKTRALVSTTLATGRPEPMVLAQVKVREQVFSGWADNPEVQARLYTPPDLKCPAPALLYVHGGGFVLGRAADFDPQCKDIAQSVGCLVASVDYRLAPENPYPAALVDCYAVLLGLTTNADEFGVDVSRVAVGGTSAGGGIAAALALFARDHGQCHIAFQFLEAPMLDHRSMTPSSLLVHIPKVWDRRANQLAWTALLGPGHELTPASPYASPAMATSLSNLSPAYICVSALDLFLDECVDYARRLHGAGVPTELHVYPNGFHGSPRIAPATELSKRWRADATSALKAALH